MFSYGYIIIISVSVKPIIETVDKLAIENLLRFHDDYTDLHAAHMAGCTFLEIPQPPGAARKKEKYKRHTQIVLGWRI